MIAKTLQAAARAALLLSLAAGSAHAQTAEQYNRASQAIQICSSAQGAFIPECAKLRGQFGGASVGAPSGLGLGGLGGGKAGAAAGILGAVMGAANRAPPPASPAYAPPAINPQVLQEAIATCVRTAAGNAAAIQGCLAIASRGSAAPMAPPSYAPPTPATAPNGQAPGMAIYAAGQDYRSCVAANPNNWQACVQSSGLTGQPPR